MDEGARREARTALEIVLFVDGDHDVAAILGVEERAATSRLAVRIAGAAIMLCWDLMDWW